MPLKVSISMEKGVNGFSNTGIPLYPSTLGEIKAKKPEKDYFKVYLQGNSMMDKSDISEDKFKSSLYGEFFRLEFEIEKENSKTYKFMGMDIDEEFNAVINAPAGRIIIGNLYNIRETIKILSERDRRSSGFQNVNVRTAVESRFNSMSKEDVREIVTALKNGALMDLTKDASKNTYSKLSIANMENLVKVVPAGVQKSAFTSVVLCLVHKKETEKVATSGTSDKDISGYILSGLVSYWSGLSKLYSRAYSLMCNMDIWSDLNKKIEGADVFNSKFSKCMSITDANSGEASDFGMFSFSGISKNGGMVDDNVIRSNCGKVLDDISQILIGKSSSSDLDPMDIMRGNIDDSGIDNIFALSVEELQAMSVIDSLSFVDEDAKLVRATYDMSDENERAQYVRAVIKSYDVMFRQYKPVEDYKVSDSIAELTEKLVNPESAVVDADGNSIPVLDIKTSNSTDIKVLEFKQNLLKVLKLLEKSLKRVGEGF